MRSVVPRPTHLSNQRPWFDGHDLTAELIEYGVPKDFSYHAFRHTVATFLENAGHSESERGLILNHSLNIEFHPQLLARADEVIE